MSTGPDWYKSRYSGSSGDNCVEVAMRPDAVHVRDSKDTRRGQLTVSPEAWSAFTTELGWTKSSYSGSGGGNCVEVAVQPNVVHVRDSNDTQLDQLTIPHTAWAAFTARL